MVIHVIDILEMMFSEHGILTQVYTDQGRQFTSAEFQEFAKCFKFEILCSTLRYPKSNGFIKLMVKIVKHVMSKAHQTKEGAHLVMLAYRVTPRGPGRLSPPESMNQCKFRALLPDKQHLSAHVEENSEVMIQQKQKQAECYDCTAQQLPVLQ